MLKCKVCLALLTGKKTVVCSPKCAGKIHGDKVRGKGVSKPHIQIRVNGERVYLHRYIWEQANGRKLQDGEIVHHKDENPRNNEPDNLEVKAGRAEHLAEHNYFRHTRRVSSFVDTEFGF